MNNIIKATPPRLSAFSKEERARDRTAAMLDYQAEKRAIEAKTARLRAARLAKEAADRQAEEAGEAPLQKQKPKSRAAGARKR